MAAAVGVEGAYSHQTVHTHLGAEVAERVWAGHLKGCALDARLLAALDVYEACGEAPSFGPAGVHPKQHLGPVLALGAPGARVYEDEGVSAVVLSG